VDPFKLQELVRTEASELFCVCDTIPVNCQAAVVLAMVHVAKAVEELIAMDGIDRIADRPLRDAEAQLLTINGWIQQHANEYSSLLDATDTAGMTTMLLNYMHAELVTKDAAYWDREAKHKRQIAELNALAAEKVTDLQRQLDAAHAAPMALNVTVVPGLPGTWSPSTEVR
jgi:hypothetical protein